MFWVKQLGKSVEEQGSLNFQARTPERAKKLLKSIWVKWENFWNKNDCYFPLIFCLCFLPQLSNGFAISSSLKP